MATVETILSTSYKMSSINDNDNELEIDITIKKDPGMLDGVTELDMITFVRNYIATLTPTPVIISKIQTIQTDGL